LLAIRYLEERCMNPKSSQCCEPLWNYLPLFKTCISKCTKDNFTNTQTFGIFFYFLCYEEGNTFKFFLVAYLWQHTIPGI
jgi:hypothetical protein